jgi:hypothetical protein
MSFSSGTYSLPGPALNTGDTVSATENNAFRNDVATAFNLTWLRNGTAAATADIPMGGFKLTGLGVATASGDALSYGQAATVSDLTVTNPANLPNTFGFKNRIINGAMMIDQRNAGSAVSVASNNVAYTVDRWGFFSYQATQSVQQVSASAGGYQYGLQITGATGATEATLYQRIESKNAADLASKAITLSFRVYNSEASKTLVVDIDYANSADNFGAITNFSSTSLTIPNGWSTQTITATAHANVVNGIQVQFKFGAVASANTRILTGVQLEKGSTATSFDYRPYGTELSLCQRYFVRMVDPPLRGVVGSITDASRVACSLPVQMRSAPTISFSQVGPTGNARFFDGTTSTGVISTLNNQYSTNQRIELDFTTTASTYVVGRASCLYIDTGGNYSSAFNITAEL